MNKRYYCIELILYLDNEDHRNLMSELLSKYDYAYILHDMDKNDDGSLKKSHYHLLIFFKNARWGSSILKEIKIDNSNLIEFRENKVSAIQYLIHSNNLDKFQYNFEDIQSNINLEIYFSDLKNNEYKDISIIYEYIDSFKGLLSFKNLFYYSISNNLWSSYRRNYALIKDLIVEHNNKYTLEERSSYYD